MPLLFQFPRVQPPAPYRYSSFGRVVRAQQLGVRRTRLAVRYTRGCGVLDSSNR